MADFMILMKGDGRATSDDWGAYIDTLRKSPLFRGGSSLGNGVAISDKVEAPACTVTGFMRFEASTIGDVRALLDGNPLYEAGGDLEILELVRD